MNDRPEPQKLLGYDIHLDRICRTIWRRRKLVLVSVFSALLLGIVDLHFASYTYTATLMISPVPSSATNGVPGKIGGLGGLASLAGINIGGDTGTQDFMLYQEGIFSRDVADDLAKDPDITHTVFRDQWNAADNQWTRPSDVRMMLVKFVKDGFGLPNNSWQPPGGASLQEYIAARVTLESDPRKPTVIITYDDADPQFAVRFLKKLDRAVDNKLRANALARASQYSDYVSDQLNKITNADIREALMTTLTDQEKIKMMASVTTPYAAQPFGPPSASLRPTHPRPLRVLFAAVCLGGLIGLIAALWLPDFRLWPPTELFARFKNR